MITSPGSTSLTNSAPIVSSAQVSDVTIYALSLFPMQRGLKPNGSLAAISFLGLSTTSASAHLRWWQARLTAASAVFELRRSLAI